MGRAEAISILKMSYETMCSILVSVHNIVVDFGKIDIAAWREHAAGISGKPLYYPILVYLGAPQPAGQVGGVTLTFFYVGMGSATDLAGSRHGQKWFL